MTSSKVRIISKDKKTEVFIDDHKIGGVRYINFTHGSKKSLPVLKLELLTDDISLDTDIEPVTQNGKLTVGDIGTNTMSDMTLLVDGKPLQDVIAESVEKAMKETVMKPITIDGPKMDNSITSSLKKSIERSCGKVEMC